MEDNVLSLETLELPFDDDDTVPETHDESRDRPEKEKITIRKKARGRRRSFAFEVRNAVVQRSPDLGACDEPTDMLPLEMETNALSLDTLELPFDDYDKVHGTHDEPKMSFEESPEIGDEPEKAIITIRKKARGRRRSADFEVLNTVVLMSPDPGVDDELADMLPLGQFRVRRSHRIRRKSLELYRTQTVHQAVRENIKEDVPTETVQVPRETFDEEEEEEADGNSPFKVKNTSDFDNHSSVDAERISLQSPLTVTDDHPIFERGGIDEELQSDRPEDICTVYELGNNSTSHIDEEAAVDIVEEDTSESAPKRKNAKKKAPGVKRGRKSCKRKSPVPALEDIYQNKLWRTQMPQDRTWETIYESPRLGKCGGSQYQSAKRFKRQIITDEFYTTARLKRRRQKALKQGWKPLTKKRDEKADALLAIKMSLLEAELEEIEKANSIAQEARRLEETVLALQFTRVEDDDAFYTPLKSVSDLVHEDAPGSQCNTTSVGKPMSVTLPSSTVVSSISEPDLYATPMKSPSEFIDNDQGKKPSQPLDDADMPSDDSQLRDRLQEFGSDKWRYGLVTPQRDALDSSSETSSLSADSLSMSMSFRTFEVGEREMDV